MSEIEDELRRQLQAQRVTHEPAVAARMTAVAVAGGAPTGHRGGTRSWIAPLSAAAAVVALGGGVVALATSGGDGSTPAGHGPAIVYHGRYVPCSTDGPVSSTPPPPPPTRTDSGVNTPSPGGPPASVGPGSSTAVPSLVPVMPTSYTDGPTPSRTEAPCLYDVGTASNEPPPTAEPVPSMTMAPPTAEPTSAEPSRTSSLDASPPPSADLKTDVYGAAPPFGVNTDTAAGTSSTVYGLRVPAGKKLEIGAVRLDVPRSDTGTISLRIAGPISAVPIRARFLTKTLDGSTSISDLAPLVVVPAGSAVQVDVTCANATAPCRPSISLDAHLVPAG